MNAEGVKLTMCFRERFGSDVAAVQATPVGLAPGGDAFTVALGPPGAPAPA